MTARLFVDSNVLVYARDASEPEKQARAREWMASLWSQGRGRVSAQVLNEFYVTVTRKLKPGLSREEARKDVRDLASWNPIATDGRLLEAAWNVEDRHGLSFWDALIVAAAHAAGCDRLLTEDLKDGQDFGGLTVVDPFRNAP